MKTFFCICLGLSFFVTGSTGSADEKDEPKNGLAKPPTLPPEVEALSKAVREPKTPDAERAKAWKSLRERAGPDASIALAWLLADKDPKVALAASDALKVRDKPEVHAAVLAALKEVAPEKWSDIERLTPAQIESWRALGLYRIELHPANPNVRRGKLETVHESDKNKKVTAARLEYGTPIHMCLVVGHSDKAVANTTGTQFIKLCKQDEKSFDTTVRRLAKEERLVVFYEAPGPQDRQAIQFGLKLISLDTDGRKAVNDWWKDYNRRCLEAWVKARREKKDG